MRHDLTESKGFTLIELLVVVTIIGILVGLLLPALGAAKTRARIIRARAEIQQLATAWLSYYDEYRKFPSTEITIMDSNAVAILRGTPEEDVPDNPHKIKFHDFNTNTIYFCDPWGVRNTTNGVYHVALDTNLDNTVSARGNVLYLSVAVWSDGPDRQPNTDDDVLSWRK